MEVSPNHRTEPISARVRRFALKHRAWTRRDLVTDLGKGAASALSNLITYGEVAARGRGVYSLPGIHESDPALLAAFGRAGSKPYSAEEMATKLTPIERRETQNIRRRLEKTKPGAALVEWMRARRYATTDDVRSSLGPASAALLADLVDQGKLHRLATSLYASTDIEPGSDEADAAISSIAARESEAVRAIDEALTTMETTQHDPEFAGKAVFKRWNSPPDPSGKSLIQRVYIEIEGHPTIFAQKSPRRVDGKPGTIAWKAKSSKLPEYAVMMLARKVFPLVPTFFWEIAAMVPESGKASYPLTTRCDAYSNVNPSEDSTPVDLDFDRRHLLPCAYVIGDTKKLDPAKLAHPIPEPVRLYVDHREPPSIITALRRVPNLEVVRTELDVGDYLVEGHVIFERKSANDFVSSIKDGADKLMLQAEGLAATGLHRILLIEGGPYAQRVFNLNRLESTLSYIRNDNGIHIVGCMNQLATAYIIVQSIKHRIFGRGMDARMPDPTLKRQASGDPTAMARLMLGYLDGVSQDRVTGLVNHFGSLAAIAAATPEQLREVKGIGAKLAAHIHDVFHHRISMAQRPSI